MKENKNMNKEHELNINEFILDEIVSIECIGDKETIDITVEDTHMFYANDVYTHNSAAEEEVVMAQHAADSYRKIMTADFIMSLSRMTADKVSNTARVHIIKNRFGPDGMTFPTKMNASCGDIQIFSESSREGIAVMNQMGNDENIVKKMLNEKWKNHSSDMEE